MPPRLSSVPGFARARVRAGRARVVASLPKILLATFGSVFSYWFAETVLGHQGPLFAATSTLISLNFASTSHVRRTLEVALGCTLGIAVGDLLLALVGPGLWQAALVVFVSLVLSRFLDSGVVFSMQFGLQSLLVMLLPAPLGGPFTRSLDAVVGGLVALLLVMLWPKDPRKEPAVMLGALLRELSSVTRELGDAMADDDGPRAWHSLARARKTQPLVERAAAELTAAEEMARLSPTGRRHRGEVERLRLILGRADLAVRNMRVLCRRCASLLTTHSFAPAAREELARVLADVGDAVSDLAGSVRATSQGERDERRRRCRTRLIDVGTTLDPATIAGDDAQVIGLVMTVRPLVVDLLEATGVRHADAVTYLPRL